MAARARNDRPDQVTELVSNETEHGTANLAAALAAIPSVAPFGN
jgi:hypothetical protein